ncbi:RSC4-like protein [Lachancea thermotolerans]
MAPKKRKAQDADPTVETTDLQRRYAAGKQPRTEEQLPSVDYHVPLDPESELFTENDWFIPKFNLFISFTLDNLVESYRNVFKDFIKLPSRKFHPGYFYKIDQPISINEIKSRDYEYLNGHRTFLLDIELIRKNCYSYNDSDSLIVKNSMQVVNYVKYEVLKAKNVTRNYLINAEVKKFLQDTLAKVFDATDKSVAEMMGKPSEGFDTSLRICEPFVELVSKDELPEYYEVIHRPSALKLVRNNLEMDYYSKIYDFYIDMILVFENALVFNDPETLIYQDAEKLLRFFRKLMQERFFVSLKDASERGEVKLEYDKFEYEQYLANGGDGDAAEMEDEDVELEDYDFNHYEGLGNGYNRTLFSGDYLLGPSKMKLNEMNPKRNVMEAAEELPEAPKYNIFNSLAEDAEKKNEEEVAPYTLIREISVTSSKSQYKQDTAPVQGALPPLNQKWVEYVFNGECLTKKNNMFSLTLPPIQTSASITAHLNYLPGANYNASLTVNKEKTNPAPNAVAEGNESPIKFEVRLLEGNNNLEFTCEDQDTGNTESFKLWIVVLP